MYRIGVDVGGTFTDLVLLDEQSGEVHVHKLPSTPADPSEAIEFGIRQILGSHRIDPAAVTFLGHGTTVATNMVIEKKGSPTGLLVTRGFRDVLEIGRQTRPSLYDYTIGKPPPVVPREHRHEITERLNVAGTVVHPLAEDEVAAAARALGAAGIVAVAICFLHAYRDSAHERRAAEIVRKILPQAFICISSDVLAEFREYERLSTTVLNAYIGPRMQAYLDRLLQRTRDIGIPVEPYTIQSNGGLMSVRTVRQLAVRTCLSGPAAGVVGATEVARRVQVPNIITFDVGGTSTDVSLVHNLTPMLTGTRLVADYPVKTQMIDIHVIGAGGGSIAWLDDAGGLKVGPHSAGADPGPACYGKGGTEPTITDANICLGRLDPDRFLGGRMKVDAAAAHRAIELRVAGPLGLTVDEAAHGMLRIANANMSRAIRSVSTERGYNIGDFTLFAFGGAGPLHGAEVAQQCGLPRIIVPWEPGTMCARGMLLTDIRLDFVRSEIFPAEGDNWTRVGVLFAEMMQRGDAWLASERVEPAKRHFDCTIEARYQGQNFEVKVPVNVTGPSGLMAFLHDFTAAHRKEYGYDIPGRVVEIVNCRLEAVGSVTKAPMPPIAGGKSLEAAKMGERAVYFGAPYRWLPTAVFARDRLPVNRPFQGPCIIDEMSSTTIVLPDQTAHVDAVGNIVILTNPEETRHV